MKFFLKTILFVFLFVSFQKFAFSQSLEISGKVCDAKGKGLSFVNITETGTTNGTSTDIDGKFKIITKGGNPKIKFSFLGYETRIITYSRSENDVFIALIRSSKELGTVTVKAGKNPADDLIEKVSANRKNLDPQKAESYKYTSYNRMVGTGVKDSAAIAKIRKKESETGKPDSSLSETEKFLEAQHLFLIETVTENKFKKPEKLSEVVIASKTSGLKDPTISMLITQLQSFSFYKENFSLGGINYLNPLSTGSTSKYFFDITDTSFSGADTIISIFYRPRVGSNFDGMTGILNINKNKLALESAIAKPADDSQSKISIKQNYEPIEDRWFPVQAHSEIELGMLSTGAYKVVFFGSNYLYKVTLNEEIKNREFGGAEVEIDPLATEKPEKILSQYRPDSTTSKDLKTYHVIDSIGKEMNFDRMLLWLETFLSGKLRLKYIDLDLNRIIRFNNFEGFRFGAGLETNEKMFRWASIGGYFGYGLKDKNFKYGGNIEVFFNKRRTYSLNGEYYWDLLEAGSFQTSTKTPFLGRDANRNLLINRFDKIENFGLTIKMIAKPVFRPEIGFRIQNIYAQSGYKWQENDDPASIRDRFRFSEFTFAFRYSPKEKFLDNGRFFLSLGTKYPVFNFNFTQGIKGLAGGEFTYSKAVASINYDIEIRKWGKSSFALVGGYVQGNIPYMKLFNMRGNHSGDLQLVAQNAFETMRMNEFAGDRFLTFFYRHNFGNHLINGKYSKPEFIISHGMGITGLSRPQSHINFAIKPMNKGYYESGFIIDNLLKLNQIGLGVGVFYRYGPYALPKVYDNFSFKLSFRIGL